MGLAYTLSGLVMSAPLFPGLVRGDVQCGKGKVRVCGNVKKNESLCCR